MAYTAQQLVNLVCQICKAPGMTQQCGQFLNMVLEDLWMHQDLQMNRVTTTINVPGGQNNFGPYTLPLNYARVFDLFYNVSGQPEFLFDAGLKNFDSEYLFAGQGGYPYEYATDLSPTATQGAPLLYIYPGSATPIALTLRYMVAQPDITGPESSGVTPWFPDQSYLIKATAAKMMDISDDERQPQFAKQADEMLKRHLIMDGDEQTVVKTVTLDPRRFRVRSQVRRTKVSN
jgi:hypothetical protein